MHILRAASVSLVVLLSMAQPADAISESVCAQVRYAVSMLGVDGAVKAARERGYSWKQIRAARRCLHH
jgi:hypothetical protein